MKAGVRQCRGPVDRPLQQPARRPGAPEPTLRPNPRVLPPGGHVMGRNGGSTPFTCLPTPSLQTGELEQARPVGDAGWVMQPAPRPPTIPRATLGPHPHSRTLHAGLSGHRVQNETLNLQLAARNGPPFPPRLRPQAVSLLRRAGQLWSGVWKPARQAVG